MNEEFKILAQSCFKRFSVEDYTKSNLDSLEAKGMALRPLYGKRVVCGLFGISDDYIEDYLSLDNHLITNPHSTFFYTASNNSMEPLIVENDILVTDHSIEVLNNTIGIFALDGELICKRLVLRNGYRYLSSDNSNYKEILITQEMDLIAKGRVISIGRKLS